jgi:hypothetical protein
VIPSAAAQIRKGNEALVGPPCGTYEGGGAEELVATAEPNDQAQLEYLKEPIRVCQLAPVVS